MGCELVTVPQAKNHLEQGRQQELGGHSSRLRRDQSGLPFQCASAPAWAFQASRSHHPLVAPYLQAQAALGVLGLAHAARAGAGAVAADVPVGVAREGAAAMCCFQLR